MWRGREIDDVTHIPRKSNAQTRRGFDRLVIVKQRFMRPLQSNPAGVRPTQERIAGCTTRWKRIRLSDLSEEKQIHIFPENSGYICLFRPVGGVGL